MYREITYEYRCGAGHLVPFKMFLFHSDLHIPHCPGLAPKPSHGTTSAPAKQQALKTKRDI